MKLKTIDLPRKYEYIEGETPLKYKKFEGWNKLSISQVNSFSEEQYKGDYYGGYFLGIEDEGNIFASYGNACGTYWEKLEVNELLSEEDVEVLKKVPRPSTAKYETEIVLDLEPFGLKKTCLQGFIDQEDEPETNSLIITDMKTGNFKDKPAYYASQDYQQTTVYCYTRDLEGYKILDSQVYLLERLGNTLDKTVFSKAGNPLWLRLSGKMKVIPTPYSRKRAEKYLKQKVSKVAVEISDAFSVYNKYFKNS